MRTFTVAGHAEEEMKFGFQINLDVKDRPCIVVGGGDEATEKTTRLLDAGARVTVISPNLSDELKVLAASAKILPMQDLAQGPCGLGEDPASGASLQDVGCGRRSVSGDEYGQ